MTQHNARLIIDLGNSQTRIAVVDEEQPKLGAKIIQLSNHYTNVTPDIVQDMPDSYTDDTTVLDVGDSLWANGSLVENEYRMNMIRPTSLEKKYESEISMVTVRLALYHATCVIARYYSEDVDACDVKWNIVVLLPPNDVAHADQMIDNIKGIGVLDVAYPGFRIAPEIDKVKVLAEGLAAYIGCVMVSSHEIRKGYKEYMGASVLVVDIGAGTTDLCIIDHGKTVENTKDTIEIGGTKIQVNLSQRFRSQSRFGVLDDTVVASAAETGILKLGSKTFDVSDEVNEVKSSVADELAHGILEYFERISFSLNTLSYILVVGGGSLSAENVKSMADLLSDSFRRFAKYTEPMPVPDDLSPRLLNLLGGVVYAESI